MSIEAFCSGPKNVLGCSADLQFFNAAEHNTLYSLKNATKESVSYKRVILA